MLSRHCPVEIASVGSISGSHLKSSPCEERVRVVRSGLVTPRKNIENCNESVEDCKLQKKQLVFYCIFRLPGSNNDPSVKRRLHGCWKLGCDPPKSSDFEKNACVLSAIHRSLRIVK